MGLGYRVAVKDPYCLTLTKGGSIIDLYVHPSLGRAIIINGQRLLEHSCTKEFNGTEVRSLKGYAEVLVTAFHAIYKELILRTKRLLHSREMDVQQNPKACQRAQTVRKTSKPP